MAGLKIPRDTFFDMYYPFALECAGNTLAGVVKSNGALNKRIDQDLVKSLAACCALDKVFQSFDVDRATDKGIQGFIYKVVHNQTLTELGKATTIVKPLAQDVDTLYKNPASLGYSKDSFYCKRRKEDFIADMMMILKTLPPEDQELIGLWMDDDRTYIERALEILGLEDTPGNRNMIAVRFNRAKARLRKSMDGKTPNFEDVYDDLPASFNALPGSRVPVQLRAGSRRQQKVAAEITKSLDYRYMAERLYDMLAG